MDGRIRFFSDDSYYPCGRKRVHGVTAGVAIAADKTNIHNRLLEAERISKKNRTDWHRTHPHAVRERYLEAVFEIESIRSRIFFRPFDVLAPDEQWGARIGALDAAIRTFTTGRCQHAMYPEGLTRRPREQLMDELKSKGRERVTQHAALFEVDPEVRLADALAGYIRAELYRGDGQRAALTNIPDWFVNLEYSP